MNELRVFNFNKSQVRTTMLNNEPYFCLKDVCSILEVDNASQLKTRLKKDGVIINEVIDSLGRKQNASFINEGNLYKTIFQSRKKEAVDFQDWVTDDVLPTLRKTGGYQIPRTFVEALRAYANEVELNEQLQLESKIKDQQIGELKPKADYYDSILKNKGTVTITSIAKDYGMSGKGFNEKLHSLGVQYKQSGQWLLYSKYQDKGYTHSETYSFTRSDGNEDIKMNTKWTQKGRLFLYDLLKADGTLPMIEKEVHE